MAIIDILLPKMGESVAEATITKLVVDAGAGVEADEPIVEIATDKVDSEVPAPEDGTLVEWCVAEGDVVQVGAVIARYDVGGDAAHRTCTCRRCGTQRARCACCSRRTCSCARSGCCSHGASGQRTFSKRSFRPFLFAFGEKHCPKGRHRHGRTRTSARHGFGGTRHQEGHLGLHRPARTTTAATPAPAPVPAAAPTPVAPAADVSDTGKIRPTKLRPAWMAPTTSWRWTGCAR